MDINLHHSFTKPSTNGVSDSVNDLNVEIIRDTNSFDSLQDEWEELTDESDYFIYQTFEWNRVWWDYFGTGKQLHILALYKEGKLMGLIPLFWDTITLYDFKVYSSLRFLGSSVSQPDGENLKGLHPYSDYLDIIIRPGHEKSVISSFIKYIEQQNLDFNEIVLDEIPECSTLWSTLLPALHKKGIDYSVENSSECPWVKLEGTWDDYQQSLSKKSRYNNNRALRMVDEDSEKGFHIREAENSQELYQSFDLLVKLHQDRWNQLGFPGVFAEKRMYNFQRKIVSSFFKKGWVQIRMAEPVHDAGNTIAVDLLFKYKKHVYLVHRALDQDSPFSKAGPGNVLLSVAIKKAADNGYKTLDFLRGTENFKFRTANTVAQNKQIVIKNPSRKSGYRIEFLKTYIKLKRRMAIEWSQLLLFVQGKTELKGFKGYVEFIHSRLSYKLAEWKKN
ncbi:MAG: GNAT family N-acetyltransferase [Balneolaceae bacterium]